MPQNPLAGSDPGLIRAALGTVIRGTLPPQGVQAMPDMDGVRAQSTAIGVPATVDSGATYQIRVLGTTEGIPFDQTYSFTTSSTSGSACRDGLIAAMRADSALGIFVASITAGTNLITLGFADGRTAAVSAPSNATTTVDLTVTTTAPGWTSYTWGRAAQVVAASPLLSTQYDQGVQLPVLPTLGTLVLTLATNTNSQTFTGVYLHTYGDGQPPKTETLTVSSAATAALTTAAIVTAAAALWPTASVEITTADEEVTVTFPAGEQVTIISEVNTSTLDIGGAVTAAGDLPELCLIVQNHDEEPIPVRSGVTSLTGPAQGSAPLTARGTADVQWCVTAPGTSFASARVYVDASGVLYDAPAVTRIPWPGARWVTGSISGIYAALEV